MNFSNPSWGFSTLTYPFKARQWGVTVGTEESNLHSQLVTIWNRLGHMSLGLSVRVFPEKFKWIMLKYEAWLAPSRGLSPPNWETGKEDTLSQHGLTDLLPDAASAWCFCYRQWIHTYPYTFLSWWAIPESWAAINLSSLKLLLSFGWVFYYSNKESK